MADAGEVVGDASAGSGGGVGGSGSGAGGEGAGAAVATPVVAAGVGGAGPGAAALQVQSACVFQCKSCHIVVGDTTAFVEAREDMRVLVLNKVSNVMCQTTTTMSQEGVDNGSAYQLLHCKNCKAEVGRVYRTTAPHMDAARNNFTFAFDSVLTYQLGSGDQSNVPIPMSHLEERILYLEEQSTKMQNLILLLNERTSAEAFVPPAAAEGRDPDVLSESSLSSSESDVGKPRARRRSRQQYSSKEAMDGLAALSSRSRESRRGKRRRR